MEECPLPNPRPSPPCAAEMAERGRPMPSSSWFDGLPLLPLSPPASLSHSSTSGPSTLITLTLSSMGVLPLSAVDPRLPPEVLLLFSSATAFKLLPLPSPTPRRSHLGARKPPLPPLLEPNGGGAGEGDVGRTIGGGRGRR